jgi:hypothetical protein
MPQPPRILALALLLAACGDSVAGTTSGESTGGSSGEPVDPTTGTTSPVDPTTGTTSPVDPTTGTTSPVDPTTGSTTDLSTTTTTTTDTTDGSTTGTTTGDPPPPAPELTCPDDPDGGCDAVPDAPLEAGAAVLSLIPNCFEGWVDTNGNATYDIFQDDVLDCGCDRKCPGDPDYPGPDAGEGNFTLQPIYLAGFGNNRPATGVRGAGVGLVGDGDGLWARALVLRQGETTVAIVTLDTIGWFNDDVLAVRQALADQDLAVDYLLVHSIHNHEGPDTMGLWGPVQLVSGYDDAYRAQVRATVVDAVADAHAARVPVAELRVGEVDVGEYHDSGVANVIRDSRDPWVVDEFLGAAQLVDGQGDTIATMVSFGNHPETLADDNLLITADFVHGVRRAVEQGSQWQQAPGKPGVGGPCLYLNAAVGGMMTPLGVTVVNPDGDSYTAASFEKADSIGQLLGEMALDALADADIVADAQLDVQAQTFPARVDNVLYNLMFQAGIFEREVIDMQDGMYITTEMSLINLGPLQLLSVPGELLPELGVGGYDGSHVNAPGVPLVDPQNPNPPALDQAPPGPYLKDRMFGTYRWIVGLGNDELGYLIPDYDYKLADNPYIEEAEGDHYEETNSLGPAITGLVEQHADLLLDWSKWKHGE